MTAVTIAPLARAPSSFTNLGVLRKQECERVAALRTELTKCKASVTETGDTLDVATSSAAGARTPVACEPGPFLFHSVARPSGA